MVHHFDCKEIRTPLKKSTAEYLQLVLVYYHCCYMIQFYWRFSFVLSWHSVSYYHLMVSLVKWLQVRWANRGWTAGKENYYRYHLVSLADRTAYQTLQCGPQDARVFERGSAVFANALHNL